MCTDSICLGLEVCAARNASRTAKSRLSSRLVRRRVFAVGLVGLEPSGRALARQRSLARSGRNTPVSGNFLRGGSGSDALSRAGAYPDCGEGCRSYTVLPRLVPARNVIAVTQRRKIALPCHQQAYALTSRPAAPTAPCYSLVSVGVPNW